MPIYDFQCTKCGYQQELMRKVSAPGLETCPQCQQLTFSKKLSAPNFQLTGSGWYASDFKNNTGNAPSESTSAAGSSGCAPGCACH